ncbi:MAG: glycosyltransferase family 4 protein [Gorillibacterium sp.]|nr:glycosyltransferase family 4 protein [Gorillibacterium sp.]
MSTRKVMLFAHLCNPQHMTGAEKLLLFQLKEWSNYFSCTLVVPEEGQLADEARFAGIPVIIYPYSLHWRSYEPEADFLAETDRLLNGPEVSHLANLLHMHRPDLVVSHTCVNFLPALAAERLGIPVCWCITERMKQTPYTHQAATMIDRYATWVVGISQTVLEPFHAAGLTQKLRIQYPSWRHEELEPQLWSSYRQERRSLFSVADSEILIGYLASDLITRKGFEHFIALALKLAPIYPQARFLIAGNPTDQALYQSCMETIHLSGYASRFVIQPYSSQIQYIYPVTDVVVVLSLIDEGFGLTALEAMAFAKPVIVYGSGALGEVQAAVGNGHFIVPTGDINRLVQVISQLLESDGLRQATASHNQVAAESMFGITAYRARLNAFFSEVEPHLQSIDAFSAGVRQTLPNGALVQGNTSAVFRLEWGLKRPFPNQETFELYGGNWAHIIHTTDFILQAFPTGAPISAAHPPSP